MKLKPTAIALCLSISGFASHTAMAACDVNFNYQVEARPAYLKVYQDEQLLMLYDQQALSVDGKPVELSDEQRRQLEQFSRELSGRMSEIYRVARQAVAVAMETIHELLEQLLADTSSERHKLMDAIDELQRRLEQHIEQLEQERRWEDRQHTFDQVVDQPLQQKLSDGLSEVIGDLVGEAIKLALQDQSEQQQNVLDSVARLGDIKQVVQDSLSGKVNQMDMSGEKFCRSMLELKAMEKELHKQLPETSQYHLIEVKTDQVYQRL